MKALVTGGAGFIGSHLVDALLARGHKVTVYDNLSTGRLAFLTARKGRLRFFKGDVLDGRGLASVMKGHDTVFHFAANADVRGGVQDTNVDLRQNVVGTYSVLEAMRRVKVRRIVYASSATVYGEPSVFPTPETCPLVQTSLYGAAKLSGEAFIEAYGEYFGFRSWTFRFTSWLGERYTHGVIYDFIKKLRKDPRRLEILGDGRQKKSFLCVEDGVAGILTALKRSPGEKEVFNLGHDKTIPVRTVADLVCREMGLKKVRYRFSGGTRGWLGDSPVVHLDCRRLKRLGWRPRISIEDGIRRTARYLLDHPQFADRH